MNTKLLIRLAVILILTLLISISTTPSSAQNPLQPLLGTTTRVSVASDGSQGNNDSDSPADSSGGLYVAFASDATNLVPDDTNATGDVFVHDRQTVQTTRVSVASDGTQGNALSRYPSISGDGQHVAFVSWASNLVPGDTNNLPDAFVHDRETGETTRVSVASDGTQGDGQVNLNYPSSISADGRYVAFDSDATNLVPGDTNTTWDIFVHDLQTGETSRASVASDGTQANGYSSFSSISSDGRYVAFRSWATNLVPNDTNGAYDIFVHDRQTGTTTRVSVASDGTQGNGDSGYNEPPSISADGRWVSFTSKATNLVPGDTNGCEDVFLHDLQIGETSRVSVASDGVQGNGQSGGPSVSANGRYVAFWSVADNLVPGDTNGITDVFVRDRQTDQTTRVSVASDGTQGNGLSGSASISVDASFVAFCSDASNLVSGDTNGFKDIFVHDWEGGIGYSISGRIIDSGGIPISGVNNSAGSGYSAITDSQGNYTITDLLAGTYTITPSLDGYNFSPPTRTVSVPPNAVGVDFTGTPNKNWTLIFYLDGDNNLDSTYPSIFNRLEVAANNSNVQIIVLWDRLGNNNSAYYLVQYDTDLNKFATYTENVNKWSQGELNMGAEQSLVNFVNWVKSRYPAQHYSLILSNHGSGLGGGMVDDTSSGDHLTIIEMGSALSTITGNGANKISVLYLDACLMGMIEDAYQFRNYAEYYVASENIQWSYSLPYQQYVSSIVTDTLPEDLATIFTYSYANVAEINNDPYTMSAGNLSHLGDVVTATNSLAQLLNSNMSTISSTLTTINQVVQRYEMNGDMIIDENDDYIDLYDFAWLVKSLIDNSEIKIAAQSVMDSINIYIVLNRNSNINYPRWNLQNSHGLSIFFPSTASSFYNGNNYDFATGAIWPTHSLESFFDTQESIMWGPMLIDYFQLTQPGGPDNPNPPDPLPRLIKEFKLFLPVTIK